MASPSPSTVERCSFFQVSFFFSSSSSFPPHCRVTHPQPSECFVSETVPRVPSCLCLYRCFPPRSLSAAHRARTGKFFKILRRNFQPLSLPSSFSRAERFSRTMRMKGERKLRNGGRKGEKNVATRLSRMHNSRLCPWTDGSSEFNDLDAPRP